MTVTYTQFNGESLPIKDIDNPSLYPGIYEMNNGFFTDSLVVFNDHIEWHWDKKRKRMEGAWNTLPYFYDAYREMLLDQRMEEKHGKKDF